MDSTCKGSDKTKRGEGTLHMSGSRHSRFSVHRSGLEYPGSR